jgi:hypothetical protein
VLYGKLINKTGNDTSGDVVGLELFWKNQDGSEVQLTHNGVLYLSKNSLTARVDGETIAMILKYTDSTKTVKVKDEDGTDMYVLGIPDGGVPIEKLATDIVDGKTLTIGTKLTDSTSDGDAVVTKMVGGVTVNCQYLKIRDGGVGEDQIADDAVSARTIKMPNVGAGSTGYNASLTGLCMFASGSYQGTGGTITVNAFDDGVYGRSNSDDYGDRVIVRHVIVASTNHEKVEAFQFNNSGEQAAWDQISNASFGTDAISMNGNKFTVYGDATNYSGRYYYWFAWGEWVPRT